MGRGEREWGGGGERQKVGEKGERGKEEGKKGKWNREVTIYISTGKYAKQRNAPNSEMHTAKTERFI